VIFAGTIVLNIYNPYSAAKSRGSSKADAADDRDLVAKSVRLVGPQAIPPRSGEPMRRLADLTYPLKPDGESRCLSVGRGITLSGEVNSCDKLLIEGSVDAKLTNCRAIETCRERPVQGLDIDRRGRDTRPLRR
jgi:hypothetical protein